MLTVPTVQQGLTLAAVIVECTVLIFVVTGILTIAFSASPPVVQSAPATKTTVPALISISTPVLPSEIEPHEPVNQVHVAPSVPVTRNPSRCEQLRQRCTSQGIQWRNTYGKGKHLTVQQMQKYLAQV